MNGPDHYREAEQILQHVITKPIEPETLNSMLAAAQVHATLALAAATAQPMVSLDAQWAVTLS